MAEQVSTTTSGPDDSRTPPSNSSGLNDAVPPASPADLGGGFAALAETLPRLTYQLRAMFFAASFREQGAVMSDGHVLRLAVALYADDGLRRHVLANNEVEGRRGLDLWAFRDELEVRDVAPCRRLRDLPGPLRVMQAATEMDVRVLARNDVYFLTPQDVWAAAYDPGRALVRNLSRYPNFVPDVGHVRAARLNPRGGVFPYAVAGSRHFVPEPGDVALARADRSSDFAEGLALNPAFVADRDDWRFAFAHPQSRFARNLARSESFHLTPRHAARALRRPDTRLAGEVAARPDFVPTPEQAASVGDAVAASPPSGPGRPVYPREDWTEFELGLLRNPHVPVTPGLVALARSEVGCSDFVRSVTQNPTFTPGAGDVAAARRHLNTSFAEGVMMCRRYLPTLKDVRLALANPLSSFSCGVGRNPNLFTQLLGG